MTDKLTSQRLSDDQTIYRWGEATAPFIKGRTPQTIQHADSLTWLEAHESPFKIAGIDCRPHTQGALSATTSQETAERFGDLRTSTGDEHINTLPKEAEHHHCDLSYDNWDPLLTGPLFLSERMEDYWDIFLHNQTLYFCHSWTGDLTILADFTIDASNTLTIHSFKTTPEPLATSEHYHQRQLDFLIRSHILDLWCPHPLPSELASDPGDIGRWSRYTYGRRAYFGSYDNTIDTQPLPSQPIEDS